MKKIIVFDKEEDIFEILGWKYTGEWEKDRDLHEKLWDAGFNLDDWDQGFCCDELLHTPHPGETEDGYDYEEYYGLDWKDDVHWLGMEMNNYCVGPNYCEFEGKHWYTVHHS